jgi:hypothetical protein
MGMHVQRRRGAPLPSHLLVPSNTASHRSVFWLFPFTLAQEHVVTRILVQNCNGLGKEDKRKMLAHMIKDIDIALLQETHFTKSSLREMAHSALP